MAKEIKKMSRKEFLQRTRKKSTIGLKLIRLGRKFKIKKYFT